VSCGRLACVVGGFLGAMLVPHEIFGAGAAVTAPMTCSRGPGGASFHTAVTMPASLPTGSTFTVRIDGVSSGTISHFGLNYIYGITIDYLLPTGTRYVEGSARIVPDTGTENVRPGARAWRDAAGIHMTLPARVDNGSSYTPPSMEFAVTIEAAAGKVVALQFDHYEVMASAMFVGTVSTTCEPNPKPYALAQLRVTPATTP
jgi:hypothetical protein